MASQHKPARLDSDCRCSSESVAAADDSTLEVLVGRYRKRLECLQLPDARERLQRVSDKRGQLSTPVIVPDSF